MNDPVVTGSVDVTDVGGAKRRLQVTRQALMHQMVPSTSARLRSARRHDEAGVDSSIDSAEPLNGDPRGIANAAPGDVPSRSRFRPRDSGGGLALQAKNTLGMVRHAFNAWWQFHPARAVIAIAEPFVEEFADRKPLRLLGISFGIGVVLAVTRPWRLVSVGGIAIAALKSSRLSGAALNFLSDKARKV